MTKETAKRLQRDYIPGGRRISPAEAARLVFRRTGQHEVLQCCAYVCSDVQSGPIYCGDVAEWAAATEGGGMVALCGRRGHHPGAFGLNQASRAEIAAKAAESPT